MAKICIIPARGGSKRIPRKNIKCFMGKPIIAYSIEAAKKSNLFDEIMVSTDDEEIAEIAVKYGAKMPFFRSENKSNDYATTFDVIEEVLLRYKAENIHFDFACCIYPCAPLISAETISEAFEKLQDFDSVFPVVSYSFPIQRAITIDKNSTIAFINPKFESTRSQDLLPSYHDAGQFYWFKTRQLLQNKKLMTDNTGVIVLSELQVQDIDNEVDWEIAELKYKLNNGIS